MERSHRSSEVLRSPSWERRANGGVIEVARSSEACPGSGAVVCGGVGGEENRRTRRKNLSKIW